MDGAIMGDVDTSPDRDRLRFSGLIGRTVTAQDGQPLGQIEDVIVRLEARSYPQVSGLVVKVDRRELFVPMEVVTDVAAEPVSLTTARLDLRAFERRQGEVLLKGDLLGHRLIDVETVQLIRARDVELRKRDARWVLVGLDVSAAGRLARLFGRGRDLGCRDWADFEPLIGHVPSAAQRAPLSRLRRLRPAEIADLVEDANRGERAEILDAVGGDKELEADVIEELEAEDQVEVLKGRTDPEVAEVLSRMEPDDAADLLTQLPQERRLPVLNLLPTRTQVKVKTLLSFNPQTAGGLMTTDVLALPAGTSVRAALESVRTATTMSAGVLLTVYVTDNERLAGSIGLPALLRADPAAPLRTVADADPIRISADADITDVSVRMTDFDLVTIPVVDADDHVLGVITVDDVLKSVVPDEWWDRAEDAGERPKHHAAHHA